MLISSGFLTGKREAFKKKRKTPAENKSRSCLKVLDKKVIYMK